MRRVLGDPIETFGFGSEDRLFKVGGTALSLPRRSTDKFAGAGLAGNAIPVGFTPGNIVNDASPFTSSKSDRGISNSKFIIQN